MINFVTVDFTQSTQERPHARELNVAEIGLTSAKLHISEISISYHVTIRKGRWEYEKSGLHW